MFSRNFNTKYRSAKNEVGLIWNDKTLKIKWPIKKPNISTKDKKLGTFKEFLLKYKYL